MHKLTIIIFARLLLSGNLILAQIPDQDNGSATDMIEVLVEDQDDSEYGYDTFLEQLELYKKNPLDLNKADYYELRQSGLLTELQIRDLISHIQYFGPLSSILELQTIPSFNTNDIYQIDIFADVSMSDQNALSWTQKLTAGDYALYLRSTRVLEEQAGYIEDDGTNSNVYLGSNYRVYTRLKYTYKNQMSYGFTAEKDPGEPFTAPAYFDYWSGHYFQRSSGWLRALALGDYELRIGQGLIAWSGFGMSKSIYPITIKRSGATLAPYSSVDENRFFRGAAATFGRGRTELTLFGSYNQVDANRVEIEDTIAADVSDEGFVTISALQLSGLHRSENEIEDKDAIRFISAGANLAYNGSRLSIAGAGIIYEFDAVLQEDQSPYELYDFEGSRLINGSLSYSYFLSNMLLFGETAISDNGKAGTINGLIIPVDRHIDFAIVQRYFDPGFQTFFSQTFSENSFPRNEKGMYAGIEVTPSKPWKINAYIDLYEAPWLESFTDAPAYGVDYLGTVYYKPNRNFETYLRIRHEISDRNADELVQGDLQHDIITDEAKTRIRWNLSYKITREITLRNRVEYSRYDENLDFPEFGYMLYQDVVYKPWEKPFSIAARYTVFQTDSYNTRIYAYENDILYAYSIANLSGSGQRYYMVFQYSPLGWMDTWLKLVRTTYADRDEIGSGNELITGSNRTELRLQLRFKW